MSSRQPSSPQADIPEAYQIVVRRGALAPTAAVSGATRLLRGLGDAASALLGDAYALGARALLDRKERLEDEIAERSASARGSRLRLPPGE